MQQQEQEQEDEEEDNPTRLAQAWRAFSSFGSSSSSLPLSPPPQAPPGHESPPAQAKAEEVLEEEEEEDDDDSLSASLRRLKERRAERLRQLKEELGAMSSPQEQQRQGHGQRPGTPFPDRAEAWQRRRAAEVAAKRAVEEAKALAECSFHPRINPASRRAVVSGAVSREQPQWASASSSLASSSWSMSGNGGGCGAAGGNSSVAERLYREAQEKEAKRRKKEEAARADKEECLKKECTFRPQIKLLRYVMWWVDVRMRLVMVVVLCATDLTTNPLLPPPAPACQPAYTFKTPSYPTTDAPPAPHRHHRPPPPLQYTADPAAPARLCTTSAPLPPPHGGREGARRLPPRRRGSRSAPSTRARTRGRKCDGSSSGG